jgi:hypothetical protein
MPLAITNRAASRVPCTRHRLGNRCDVASTAVRDGSVPTPNTTIPRALCTGVGIVATTASIAYTRPHGSRPMIAPSSSRDVMLR